MQVRSTLSKPSLNRKRLASCFLSPGALCRGVFFFNAPYGILSPMQRTKLEQWEGKLDGLLRRVDRALEERFGKKYDLHPARAAHGSADNPQHDGLFRVTAAFTPGFGSQLGRGYVLQIDMMTLETVPADKVKTIEREAVRMVNEGLEEVLPGRGLEVRRDGTVWKITGDLSLSDM